MLPRPLLQQAFLFIGEKRSPRAVSLALTWDDLALCSKTLHDALLAAGITPHASVHCRNLWADDGTFQPSTIDFAKVCKRKGWTIVGLGKKVQTILAHAQIEHLRLIHPAARGAIRKRERYHAHVAEVFGRAGFAALSPSH